MTKFRDKIAAHMAHEAPELFQDLKVTGEMLDKFDALCFVKPCGHNTQWLNGLIFRVIGYIRNPHSGETLYLLFCDDPRLHGKERPVLSPPTEAVRWIQV